MRIVFKQTVSSGLKDQIGRMPVNAQARLEELLEEDENNVEVNEWYVRCLARREKHAQAIQHSRNLFYEFPRNEGHFKNYATALWLASERVKKHLVRQERQTFNKKKLCHEKLEKVFSDLLNDKTEPQSTL